MKHHPPHDFIGTPHRGSNRGTEVDMTRALRNRFGTQERARAEAQRHDSDPRVMAGAFADEIEHARSEHYAVARAEALSAVQAIVDHIGTLTVSTTPEEVDQHVQDAEMQLARVFTEQRKNAEKAKDTWRQGVTAFNAWADQSGAKLQSAPWPTREYYALTIVIACLVETWLVSWVLRGPPIIGVPPPLVLGLIFAGGSLFIGAAAALGHMLAADKRRAYHTAGLGVFVLTFLAWAALCLMGAHMRASIEAGGGGTGPEILASIHQGLFGPLVSPLALLLAAASTATAAATWMKTVGYFGTPFGHRERDKKRRWCIAQLHEAEEAHKKEVRATVAKATAELDTFEARGWQPANDGLRLEREVTLIVAQARESERAIHRAHATQLTDYSNTFRRVRPDAQVGDLLVLGPMPDERLAEPESLRAQVERMKRAAGLVSGAVKRGKLRLHTAEVEHLDKVHVLYAETRGRPAGQALLPC